MGVLYVLVALIGAAGAVFALQNFDPVVIRFLVWRLQGMPLALVILVSMLCGVVFAALFGIGQQWKLRSRIRHLEARLKQADAAPRMPT
jgi:uncharacterized integral membrane protein